MASKKKVDNSTVNAPEKFKMGDFKVGQPYVGNFDLNKMTLSLMTQEPFFCAISRHITKIASTAIPTMGVRLSVSEQSFELIYNPYFCESLSAKHLTNVLIHEYYHILLGHLTERKFASVGNHKLVNVAEDLAINSLICENGIDNLPDFVCLPGAIGTPFEKYPKLLTADAYIAMLRKDKQFQQSEDGDGNGSGSGVLDDHSGHSQSSNDSPEEAAARSIAESKIKQNMRDAASESDRSSNWGSVSQQMREELRKFCAEHLVDPKRVLAYFVQKSQRSENRSTMRKVNRRMPYIQPGRTRERLSTICVAIDESGSVSDQMLTVAFAWLSELSKHVSFHVLPFDYEPSPSNAYFWKKGTHKKATRVLTGGTSFINLTNYINKNSSKYDGLVIITDCQAEKPNASKIQRLWITSKADKANMPFQINEPVICLD